MKYRGRLNIIADILNAANENVKKTRIMYIANLSYKLLEKYLGESIRIGLIRYTNDGYKVTDKGRIFLEKYNKFTSKYSKIKKKLESLWFEEEVLDRMCSPVKEADLKANVARRKRRENRL